jgi:hypothetical protein
MNKRKSTLQTNDGTQLILPSSVLSKTNMFFSGENNSKLCAEGAVKNLLYILKFSTQQIEDFWNLVTSPLSSISDYFQEDIPRAICNSLKQVNSIQKCLWLLRTKFKFMSTWKLKLSFFVNVEKTMMILRQFQFPLIISVHSRGAVYDHVVVVWQGEIFDYESETIYMLSEDAIRQMCSVNTTFSHIRSGYGLFLPKNIRTLSPEVTDWGDSSYHHPTSAIRKFFTRK